MDHCGENLRELKRATPKDQFRYGIECMQQQKIAKKLLMFCVQLSCVLACVFTSPTASFSMTTSLWIMERMLSALQFIHAHGWLHRWYIWNEVWATLAGYGQERRLCNEPNLNILLIYKVDITTNHERSSTLYSIEKSSFVRMLVYPLLHPLKIHGRWTNESAFDQCGFVTA